MTTTARSGMPDRRPVFRPWRVVLYVVVAVGALIYAMPFLWMLSTAVKDAADAFLVPPQWLPTQWHWENYIEPWRNLPFLTFYKNTALIAVTSVIGTLLSTSLVAFAFARMRFRWRGPLFVLVLSTMMLPRQVTLIPLCLLWSKLHLLNTLVPLMLPAFFAAQPASAFSIFLLQQYMLTIPVEIDDAARMDGASWLQIYGRVVVPLAAPAMGVVAIYNFSAHWNDFLEPLIYLNSPDQLTVPLGLSLMNGRYGGDVGQIMAQTTLSILPLIAIFFLAQHSYIQGVVVTGVKG